MKKRSAEKAKNEQAEDRLNNEVGKNCCKKNKKSENCGMSAKENKTKRGSTSAKSCNMGYTEDCSGQTKKQAKDCCGSKSKKSVEDCAKDCSSSKSKGETKSRSAKA